MPMARGPLTSPTFSVVIAAWTGSEALRRCLSSLLSQAQAGKDQIIVARNFALDARPSLQSEFPSVVDLSFAPEATVPQLRAHGLAAASGTIVAFIEDHCVCAAGWREAIVRAHELSFEGVGGPVDCAPGGHPLDWAVYFYDYARFAPPMQSGAIHALSGANGSYKKAFLDQFDFALAEGMFEVVLEQEARRRGLAMYLASEAIVIHGKHQVPGQAIRLAYALARGYAARRLLGASALRRVAFASATALLPPLLAARIVGATLRTRRHFFKLALALPWLLVLLCSWSLGELTGYMSGGGDSDLRWR